MALLVYYYYLELYNNERGDSIEGVDMSKKIIVSFYKDNSQTLDFCYCYHPYCYFNIHWKHFLEKDFGY